MHRKQVQSPLLLQALALVTELGGSNFCLILAVCGRPEAVQVGPQFAARTELVTDDRQHLLLRLLESTREVVEPRAVVVRGDLRCVVLDDDDTTSLADEGALVGLARCRASVVVWARMLAAESLRAVLAADSHREPLAAGPLGAAHVHKRVAATGAVEAAAGGAGCMRWVKHHNSRRLLQASLL